MKCSKIKKPHEFGKVAVLMGGYAAEREISIKSGNAVLEALLSQDVDAIAVDGTREAILSLPEQGFDRVFNIIHGRGGEDGVLQGILEIMRIPYTGSGVMASALSMDKLRTKWCWSGNGLITPCSYVLRKEEDISRCIKELGLPVIVKPSKEGSSLGMSKADSREELISAWQLAIQYECDVYAESWVEGKEYTVGILDDEALPVIRLETPHSFYDFEAKYLAETTEYHCPCGLDEQQERSLRTLALKACEVIGIEGWARVDMFIDSAGQSQLIEVNTVPGMTDHSLVPMAARSKNIDFCELVWRILETSVKQGVN